ncbi:MAG: SRPBCC family protein [Candidatus Omnitrophica bacterium]|nr:SRPBCC family protein [Candidatus Omnitrophota bacterium]
MPKINVSVKIKGPKEKVYKLIKDLERFPSFIRDVKRVNIVKYLNNGLITNWEIDVEGTPLRWKEEDYFDDKNYLLKFVMLEGDYQAYHGNWSINELDLNNTRLTLEVSFDWEIPPVLEKYIGKILERKARRSILGMLQAIKKKIEKDNV